LTLRGIPGVVESIDAFLEINVAKGCCQGIALWSLKDISDTIFISDKLGPWCPFVGAVRRKVVVFNVNTGIYSCHRTSMARYYADVCLYWAWDVVLNIIRLTFFSMFLFFCQNKGVS
jgi:hypothetical protein